MPLLSQEYAATCGSHGCGAQCGATHTYGKQGRGAGEGFAEVNVVTEAINAVALEAVATAIASAAASDEGCAAFAVVDASITELPPCKSSRCARNNGRCGGVTRANPLGNVRPCCDPNYHCVERNNGFAQCRRRDSSPPRRWSGAILDCTREEP